MAQDAGFLATWVPSIMISDPKTIHGLQNVLDLVDSIKASFIKMDVFLSQYCACVAGINAILMTNAFGWILT